MYHVNSNGEPGPCKATKGNCPFGSADEHFSSKDEARAFYEKSAGEQILTPLKKVANLKYESKVDTLLGKVPIKVKKDSLLKDMPRGLQIKALQSQFLNAGWIKEALFLNDTTLLSHIIENPNVSTDDLSLIMSIAKSDRIKAYAANHPKANKNEVLSLIRAVSKRTERWDEYAYGSGRHENIDTVVEILTQSPHFPKEMYFSKDIEPKLNRYSFRDALTSKFFNKEDIDKALENVKGMPHDQGIHGAVFKNPNITQEQKMRITKETKDTFLLGRIYDEKNDKELSEIAYRRLVNEKI